VIKIDGDAQVEFLDLFARLTSLLSDMQKCSAKWSGKAIIIEEAMKKCMGLDGRDKP
jgi:hypothetical protein